MLAGEVEEGVATWLTASVNPAAAGQAVAHTLLPFLDRFELLTVYAACDVVALPSFYDGLPNVALEAAALGIPLLASDAGGLADLVDDRIGFPFAAGDAHGAGRRCTGPRGPAPTSSPRSEPRARYGSSGDFGPAAETDGYLRVLAATVP